VPVVGGEAGLIARGGANQPRGGRLRPANAIYVRNRSTTIPAINQVASEQICAPQVSAVWPVAGLALSVTTQQCFSARSPSAISGSRSAAGPDAEIRLICSPFVSRETPVLGVFPTAVPSTRNRGTSQPLPRVSCISHREDQCFWKSIRGRWGTLLPFQGIRARVKAITLCTSKRDGPAPSAPMELSFAGPIACRQPKSLKAPRPVLFVGVNAMQCFQLLVK